MNDFVMPSLGADMDDGRLLEWYVKPGDAVKRGDIVALVDTDKAAIEIEIFEDGVVSELLVPEGEKVPVGTPLARIGGSGEGAAGGMAATLPETPPAVAPETVIETVGKPVPPEVPVTQAVSSVHATPAARRHAQERGVELSDVSGTGRHGTVTKADVEAVAKELEATLPAEPEPQPKPSRKRISPLARRLVKELGLDLATIEGTGPGGTVTKADLERAAVPAVPKPEPKPAATRVEPVKAESSPREQKQAAMRRAIGAAMAKSKREIPHYYLSNRIDVSRSLSWLEEENLERPITNRLVPAVLLLKATALAIREVPEMNGFWLDGGFKPSEDIHLGMGISLRGGGLIAPAIHNADQKDLDELMADLRDLVKRSRSGGLKSSEMTDATVTVTNMGDLGVDLVYGVIYPPQVALIGFGKITDQPWVENGMIGARPILTVTLAADHRASDGHRGGIFLTTIAKVLQDPEAL
ncbi:MAG: 2-oxo acid dehydrogenase subunit E2 [Trueperaceae bacterium]|nr:MAG: 2-oxo acid dehydrogenase subunit E2 [Trueperaceae bacterium]